MTGVLFVHSSEPRLRVEPTALDWQPLFTFRHLAWARFHRRYVGWAFHFS
jgi:hypothetical protein